jgi:hypothetical protein
LQWINAPSICKDDCVKLIPVPILWEVNTLGAFWYNSEIDLMPLKRLMRPLWIVLAAVFLFEAWLWDKLTAFGHWLRDVLPFDQFKAWLASWIERLPAWAALTLFIIPVLVVQPLKLIALWLMLHGHLVLGIAGFIAVKIVGFGAVAFLFDLTRDKLMTIRWFAWVYGKIMLLRLKATAFIAPYKQALKAHMAALKISALYALGLKNDGRSMLSRIRSRMRR